LEDTNIQTWAQFERFIDDNYTMPFYLLLELMNLYGEEEFRAATLIGRAVGVADVISRTKAALETSRCYYPEELLKKVRVRQFGVPVGVMKEDEDGHQQIIPEAFYDVVLETAAYGRKNLLEARELSKSLPGRTFIALLPAVSVTQVEAELYYARLEKYNFAVMNRQAHKSNFWKLLYHMTKAYRGRRF
jgi:phytoene/squalene synthetase